MKEKQQKQQEARERNENWSKLPLVEKVAVLKARPGSCNKQLDKLVKQLGRKEK